MGGFGFITHGLPISFAVSLLTPAMNARIEGVLSRDQTPWSSNGSGHKQKGPSPTLSTTTDGYRQVSRGKQQEIHIMKQQQQRNQPSRLNQFSRHNCVLDCAVNWTREVIQLFQARSSASCSSSQSHFTTQIHKLLHYRRWEDVVLKYGAGTHGRKRRILQADPVGENCILKPVLQSVCL